MNRALPLLLSLSSILLPGCFFEDVGRPSGDDSGSPLDDSGDGPDDSGRDTDDSGDPPDDTGPDDTGDPDALECDPSVVDWPEAWADLEAEVLVETNAVRAAGADCGVHGVMPPVGPLAMEPHLRCAARVHALDMGMRGYFDHDSEGGPLGDTFDERIHNAGYPSGWLGENIAAGYPTPHDVVAGWVASDGHCANLMNGAYDDIGVGYAYVSESKYGAYWVQDFGG